jgi:hypothetical protein
MHYQFDSSMIWFVKPSFEMIIKKLQKFLLFFHSFG